jgi:hypothetical protein
MGIKLINLTVLLLLLTSLIEAQNIDLDNVTINDQSLKILNCDFNKKWGEGKLLKQWNGDNDEYTLVYKMIDYDSIEVLTANYKETRNSYLELITIKSSRALLKINGSIIPLGISIETLGLNYPSVLKEYNDLIIKNNKYLLRETIVSAPLKINKPPNEVYFGKLSFVIINHKVININIDLRSEGDFD